MGESGFGHTNGCLHAFRQLYQNMAYICRSEPRRCKKPPHLRIELSQFKGKHGLTDGLVLVDLQSQSRKHDTDIAVALRATGLGKIFTLRHGLYASIGSMSMGHKHTTKPNPLSVISLSLPFSQLRVAFSYQTAAFPPCLVHRDFRN
jgi:hypothetical protein